MNSVLIQAYDHGCDGRVTGTLVGYYWIPAELASPISTYRAATKDIEKYVKKVYGDDIGWYALYLVPISERKRLIARWKSDRARLSQLLKEAGHE